jgi:hypothetical protein
MNLLKELEKKKNIESEKKKKKERKKKKKNERHASEKSSVRFSQIDSKVIFDSLLEERQHTAVLKENGQYRVHGANVSIATKS